jgi:hypothetical protein
MDFILKHPICVLLALCVFLYLVSPSRKRSDDEKPQSASAQSSGESRPRYESSWRSDSDRGISVALAKNQIRDCGEYAYKRSSDGSAEYLVRCKSDRVYRKKETGEVTKILFYQVWPNINSVVGPFSEEPGTR